MMLSCWILVQEGPVQNLSLIASSVQPCLLPLMLLGPVRGKEGTDKHLYSLPGIVTESTPPGLVGHGGGPGLVQYDVTARCFLAATDQHPAHGAPSLSAWLTLSPLVILSPLHSPNLLLVLAREKGWPLGCWIQTSPGEAVWSPLFGGSVFSMELLLPLGLWLPLWGWWEKSLRTCACGCDCLWRLEVWGLPLAAWESAWGWHSPLSTFFLRVLAPRLWSD